ncbi:hypothetical protein [Methylobacterium nodulans]|uniref:Uncharacterized protein n=1 Tax=Methylobacterium nodulans (strain LMG 21967 / CNCM I-2342 / ORS 2060) TaxID=460265 RepID=B8IIN1_METNO|nr:hypothetical protein [Methylobacterium nodulans]ACL59908.1 conserved hypothetical protein [Methylobacterium nodulans ORS 2060]
MSPADALAMLDRQIAENGQTVTLQHDGVSYPLRAFVRGYSPREIGNGIQQGDSKVVLSPTELAAAGFPADEAPERLDTLVISGRVRNVEYATPVELGDAVVRYDLLVRG